MNKSFYALGIKLKDILPVLILPCFFIWSFYSYFFLISSTIYGCFNLSRIETLLYLPLIYKWSYVACAVWCLFWGVLIQYRKPFVLLFPVFIILIYTIYTVQYYSLYLTSRYLLPEAFLHIDQMYLIADYRLVVRLIISFLLVSFCGYICWLMIKKFDGISRIRGKFQKMIVQALFTVCIFMILCVSGWINVSQVHKTKFFGVPATSPEAAFVRSIKQFYFQPSHDDAFKLPDDLRKYISHFYGISYQPDADYPLVKDWVYKKPIPFSKVDQVPQKPNVIIFFIEALSANLVGSYNSRMRTPHIDSFAQEGMVIDGYYNHTFPTISGIRGQLCSFYPTFNEAEYAEQEGHSVKLFCLPHVLNRHDYSSYFFSYSPALYTPQSYTLNMKKLLEACGFSKVYVAQDIIKRLTGLDDPEMYQSKKGIHDLAMMVDLVKYLKSLDNKKKPFFIALATVGTHINIGDSEVELGESLHKLDDAFGVFWKYFKDSPFYNNTIVVLTADHAYPQNALYKKFVRLDNQSTSFFDKITLIIFDKRHAFPKRLQVKASSIDLAPTILQLLGIKNGPNPFQGLSIFSDRKEHPFLLCTLMDNYYIYDANGIRNYLYTDDAKWYDDYSRMATSVFNDKNKQECGMNLWFSYNKMINNNKIWNGLLEKPLTFARPAPRDGN